MAKKKKTALPTVNRGFATTSQPKKPEPIAPEPAPTEEAVVQAVAGEGPNSGTQNGTEGEKKPGDEDWDDESKLEDAVYQGYVERLQDKGDREVARILKGIDLDRRTNKGYIVLDIDPNLKEELLVLYREAESGKVSEPINIPSNQQEKEKQLLKMYITYQVLFKLGYEEEKIVKCIEAIGEKGTWEDGLRWVSKIVGV